MPLCYHPHNMPSTEPRTYYTYIMGSISRVLYVGVTGNLVARVAEHKSGRIAGFTSAYRVTRLLYFEEFTNPLEAINRETQLKGWRREKKCDLIEARNLKWED